MASFLANLANENSTDFIQSAENNLAVIHCKVKKKSDFFAKIEIETSLDANWQMMYKGKQLLLDKITVEVGYANDIGEVTYKNSAIIANQPKQSLAPMIWVKENSQNVYHTAYSASQSLTLELSYSAAFKLNSDLPRELQDLYTGRQTLAIDTVNPSSDYSVKISIV